MDKEEVEYIAGLVVKKHESRFHKKKRAKQDKNRYNESFELFWGRFKGRWNVETGYYDKGSKYMAWEQWLLLTEKERKQATYAAPRSGGKYTKDCERWLKEKWFDNYKMRPKEKE